MQSLELNNFLENFPSFGPKLFIPLVALAILAAIALIALRRKKRGNISAQYNARPSFLSPAERSFFGVLQQSVAGNYLIFAKVRLADLIEPFGVTPSEKQAMFNRISAKHVDFLVCSSNTVKPFCVVELDDSSHKWNDRRQRDHFVDSALFEAGIPVLRMRAEDAYSPAALRQKLDSAIANRQTSE